MHTQPMPDGAGAFQDWKLANRACDKCSKETLFYRLWESSCGGYEDLQFQCRSCGYTYWIDGIDS